MNEERKSLSSVLPRIIFFTEIRTSYRQPIFERLIRSNKWDLRIALLGDRQENRPWKIEETAELKGRTDVLPGRYLGSWNSHAIFLNWKIHEYLSIQKPDLVVIAGYAQPAFWVVRHHCRKAKVPYITFTESHLSKPRTCLLKMIKNICLRSFYGPAIAHLTVGSAARDYVVHYGGRPDRVFFFPNTIDVSKYREDVLAQRCHREALRSLIQAEDGPVFLFVGQLAWWKGADTVIRGFAEVRRSFPSATLHMVGVGIPPPGLPMEGIRLHGFVQPKDLPKYYAAADIFVLPSRHETWGVVVIEAMAAGVPVICSQAAGVGIDLVKEGETGLLFSPGDYQGCAEQMKRLAGDRALQEGFVKRARHLVGEWSHERALEGFELAVGQGPWQ